MAPSFSTLDPYRVRDGLDIFVVPDFAKTFLGFDAKALQNDLEDGRYPVRAGGDDITRGEVQWVEGDNVALRYRGNTLKRGKIWLQRDDPFNHGFLRYYYTGWQWKVLPATADVAKCPEVKKVTDAYDKWVDSLGGGISRANHYIVTHYQDQNHSIGMHFDKPRDIAEGSLITVIKTGSHARPFSLAMLNDDAPFFSEPLQPGTAVIMTLEANLQTKHGVPALDYECGSSGSIVLRTITKRVSTEELDKELRKKGNEAKKKADREERDKANNGKWRAIGKRAFDELSSES